MLGFKLKNLEKRKIKKKNKDILRWATRQTRSLRGCVPTLQGLRHPLAHSLRAWNSSVQPFHPLAPKPQRKIHACEGSRAKAQLLSDYRAVYKARQNLRRLLFHIYTCVYISRDESARERAQRPVCAEKLIVRSFFIYLFFFLIIHHF